MSAPGKPPFSDTHNAKNKTCSVCNETFSSRKIYMEHVEIVHDMKFKWKTSKKAIAGIVGINKQLVQVRGSGTTTKKSPQAVNMEKKIEGKEIVKVRIL